MTQDASEVTPESTASRLQKSTEGLFQGLLGLRFRSVDKDRIDAELEVRSDLCTVPGVAHGGAVMAFADTLGGYATSANLGPGERTVTIESKSNFFGAGREGSRLVAECSALHRGRTTMVWQTRICDEGGKLIAIVTQTQMVLRQR